ncbi:MATE family efflux transporter [Anaerovorax sp. IOR16]|uniref:MATE family efflux transporter n=1 Tax=Anaerovorax sp. IOR16 TaxID=2773458 RepID=UPI0019CFDB20|nr:MATE family efflux transporter [Anaerovorax sp. IOR16]
MLEFKQKFRFYKQEKSFYSKALLIAVPIIIQHLISIGLNIVDTLMIGRVGVLELAAVGAANQIYFIFTTICYGIFSGAAVYTAQYWGVKDIRNIRRVLGIDYMVAFFMAFFVISCVEIFAPQILWLFARDTLVIALGTQYLRIACLSYLFTAMSFAISYNCRSIQNLKVPTIINAIALSINTVLNYGLIYGNFNLPKMGVQGAAIATVIARSIEIFVLLIYIYNHREHPLAGKITELFSFNQSMFKKVMKTAVPVVISEGGWSIATTITFIAYGILGPSALAVVQVASVVNEFFQSLFFGVGNAAAVMLGEELGRNQLKKAESYSQSFLRILFVMNVVITLILILIRGGIAELYQFDTVTTEMLMNTLFVWALFLTPKMIVYVLVCGILRSGGDTHYTMLLDLAGNWLLGIPLAFLGVLVFKLPLHFAVGLSSLNEIVKAVIFWKRYKSKRWIRMLID